MTIEKLLKLNLQHFADGGEPTNDPEPKGDEPNGDEPKGDEGASDKGEGNGEEKLFTQAELEEKIKNRLNREKKARDEAVQKEKDKAEQERLEENGEYKELLEKVQQQLADKDAEIAARDRKDSINTKLAAKGLSSADIPKYAKYVEILVDNEDEIDGAVDEVYNDFVSAKQAQYGDPSAGFGEQKKPTQKGDDETGKSLYQQLRGK